MEHDTNKSLSLRR
jgi:hypothetical protein